MFEATDYVGGISRTHVHDGNRIDIGGHRFISKSKRVMDWWHAVMPLQGIGGADESLRIADQNKKTLIDLPEDGPDPEETDLVMLAHPRKSRILFKGKLFDDPLSLSPDMLLKLGQMETSLIEQFLHPKFGPSQMWETATDLIRQAGSKVTLSARVTGVKTESGRVLSATIHHADGREDVLACDQFPPPLPIPELFATTEPRIAGEAGDLAAQLEYRDFMTVGLLCDRLTLGDCDARAADAHQG